MALSPEPFSVDNQMMTPTFKLKRPQAQAAFQAAIDGGWVQRGDGGGDLGWMSCSSERRQCRTPCQAAADVLPPSLPLPAEMYSKLPQ